MEYKWFTYLVNHLKSVESTVKISDLIKKEIFQPLTLNSQNALLDEQKCELQLSINNFHHAPLIYNSHFPNNRQHVMYLVTCGPVPFFLEGKNLSGKRNFKNIQKSYITMI